MSKKNKHFFMYLLLIVIFLIFLLLFLINNALGSIKTTTLSQDLNVNTELDSSYPKIKNIALFGLDTREPGDTSRSDSIIILTIDSSKNEIRMSSIMRDTYVNIPGYGYDKVNHAYAYGGAELALQTINSNFNLNIDDFVTINYAGLTNIVDYLGGIKIDVKDYEVDTINQYMEDVANLENKKPIYITSPGVQNLKGIQVVSYSRIRSVGNNDYERTERQRTVLSAIIHKLKWTFPFKYPGLIKTTSPYIQTDLGKTTIYSILSKYILLNNYSNERFPLDSSSSGQNIGGVFYLTHDEEATRKQMHDYIFEGVKPE